jgi:L-seryl-tRNA(Ser) seleniumtransferase
VNESLLRELPSVEELAALLAPEYPAVPRRVINDEVRAAIAAVRTRLREGAADAPAPEVLARHSLRRLLEPSLQRVINATGVILHTNLGRAPLGPRQAIAGYSNLEYDLTTGRRGKRDAHIAPLLLRLLGKPGIAVNNNAAAVWLALNELAAGQEVIVSRGELIEIGDGFRIPDIMTRSGAVLREVGTTNRTRIEDYREAINDRTRLLMRVHPSNFHMTGFTGRPTLSELAELGRERSIPVYEDLGSGCLVDLKPYGIDEPLAADSLRQGANLITFSGDKLLGGPQAGLIAGDPDLVQRCRRNPMFRALRLDKLIYQNLEATLASTYLEQWDVIPTLAMIRMPLAEIKRRAEGLASHLPAEVIEGRSVVGGGSTPDQSLPTYLVAVTGDAAAMERMLRQGTPPVIARIEGDRLLLDLRTVAPEDDGLLFDAFNKKSR